MISSKYWLLIGALGLGLVTSLSLPMNQPKPNSCGISTPPVISLDFGSRYTEGSKNRSDLDEDSNDAVNKALASVDRFIQDLSRKVDVALSEADPVKSLVAAKCVFSAVHSWAEADALSDLKSTNAKLSSPSRVGGIAAAFSQIAGMVPEHQAERAVVLNWLDRRAEEIVTFFDNDAPKKAARNNLRAWAGFAVAEIGIITGNTRFTDWAAQGITSMIASANSDGSLPLEMERGEYAHHYQLHATSALVASIAQLCDSGYPIGDEDLNGLDKIAVFSLNGVSEPEMVERLIGVQQKIDAISAKKTSSIAWVEAYSAIKGQAVQIPALMDFRPLVNSKLGGNLTRKYSQRSLGCKLPLAG